MGRVRGRGGWLISHDLSPLGSPTSRVALRILGMSWGIKTTCFEAPRGVMNGGSGVSLGGVKIVRVNHFSNSTRLFLFKVWESFHRPKLEFLIILIVGLTSREPVFKMVSSKDSLIKRWDESLPYLSTKSGCISILFQNIKKNWFIKFWDFMEKLSWAPNRGPHLILLISLC